MNQWRRWGLAAFLCSAFQASCVPWVYGGEPAATQVPRLPAFKRLLGIHYPEPAKGLNQEGSVLVEFSIDSDGKTTDVKVIRSDSPSFAEVAMKGFSESTFKVPADWNSSNAAFRYRVAIVFCFPPSDQATTFTESPYKAIIVAGNKPGQPPVFPIPGTCKLQ